jgi:hypothetical protein
VWRALIVGGRRSSPPHVGCPPQSLFRTSLRKLSHTLLRSSTVRSCSLLLCSTLAAASPAASELFDRTKGSASSPRPSCTKNLPAAPAHEAGPRDSAAVVFLREHLTGGNLLWFFPHPADPAASSSPTTSPATSTTPSAPHRCPLPVATRATAEVPPPMSNPFPAFASGFSCSCV